MNSRVEKYRYEDEMVASPSRVEKNQGLYNTIDMSELSRIKPNTNERVIETSPKTIDIEKIRKYIESNNEEREVQKNIVVKDDIPVVETDTFEEKRVYDINSVLEKARAGRENYYEEEKYKKLRDTQYDILSKIKMYDEDTKETSEEEPKFNTDERTLIDLINTVTINKKKEDLLGELKGDENTVVTAPISEEAGDADIINAIEESKNNEENDLGLSQTEIQSNTLIKNLDKSFYTNSMSFGKEDFEGFEELEKTVKKNNGTLKTIIIVLVLLALATLFVIFKYVLNIF